MPKPRKLGRHRVFKRSVSSFTIGTRGHLLKFSRQYNRRTHSDSHYPDHGHGNLEESATAQAINVCSSMAAVATSMDSSRTTTARRNGRSCDAQGDQLSEIAEANESSPAVDDGEWTLRKMVVGQLVSNGFRSCNRC